MSHQRTYCTEIKCLFFILYGTEYIHWMHVDCFQLFLVPIYIMQEKWSICLPDCVLKKAEMF